ncbi:TRAP transporter small permease [Falsiroseomonas oryzae]|uniref:TRAP transporter small permease n=1 Tax=Falsiroseomonas oryzae TaxID=2766473 RepID=UPI0022EA2756|nr:TRAP transporter small permease subunit [Roseomonas sp. MO-31]
MAARLGAGLLLAARWVGGIAFVAIFLTFVVAVFMRYVLREPLQWSDEFVTIAAMWAIFWLSAFVLRDRDHVAIGLVYDVLPPQGRRLCRILVALILGGLFAAAIPPVMDYVLFLWRNRTNILEWRLDFVFLCLPMFLAACVVRAAAELWAMLRPGWRATLAAEADGAAGPA